MKKQLKDLKRGETFYGAGIQWTVLDHSRSSQGLPLRTFVVSTDITENRAFDEGNKCDFAASTLRAYLNGEFLRKLEDELGAGNICEYVIDLTADDGLPKYGKDSVKVGLLTMEDYRRHRDILPPIGKWWWTATPYSGLYDYNSLLRYVYADGSSDSGSAYYGNIGVRPALNLSSGILVSDSPDSDGAYTIIWNRAPSKPSSITVPSSVRGGESLSISWGASTDEDGNLSGYILERQVNGGAWAQVYKGINRSYTDAITFGWTSIAYRVKAYDSAGAESAYQTSATRTVVNNHAPVISGTDSNLGTKTAAFAQSYSVTDEDSGQTLTVTEYIDGTQKRSYTATSGQTYSFNITAAEWVKLLNGSHTLKIVAADNYGGSATRTYTFTKNETEIELTLATPLTADDMVTKGIMSVVRQIPAGAKFTVEVCNNGNDASPTWEDVTQNVVSGSKFFLSNTTKTASAWGYNFRIKVKRGTATGDCFITSAGGNFE